MATVEQIAALLQPLQKGAEEQKQALRDQRELAQKNADALAALERRIAAGVCGGLCGRARVGIVIHCGLGFS